MFFKKRKSRRQLLNEVECLKEEVERLTGLKECFKLRFREYEDLYDSLESRIETISAKCISESDDEKSHENAKKCLCDLLAEEIYPYVSFDKYMTVDNNWHHWLHTATIKILSQTDTISSAKEEE